MCLGPEKYKAHKEGRVREEWGRWANRRRQKHLSGSEGLGQQRGARQGQCRDGPARASSGIPRSASLRAKPAFGTGTVLIPQQRPGSRNSTFRLPWEISIAHSLASFLNELEKILSLVFLQQQHQEKIYYFFSVDVKKYNKSRHNVIWIFFILPNIFSPQWETFSSSTSTQSQAQTGILNRLHGPDAGWQQPWFVFCESGTWALLTDHISAQEGLCWLGHSTSPCSPGVPPLCCSILPHRQRH